MKQAIACRVPLEAQKREEGRPVFLAYDKAVIGRLMAFAGRIAVCDGDSQNVAITKEK